MRKVALTAVCLLVFVVVAVPAADHRDGPIFGIGGKRIVKTYTFGRLPGIRVVSLKDLAKVAGATTVEAALIPPIPRGVIFHLNGPKLIALVGPGEENVGGALARPGGKIGEGGRRVIEREPRLIDVRRSGEISSKVIRHVGEVWVPLQDVVKAFGASYDTPPGRLRPGQDLRASVRGACDCIFTPR